MLLCCSCFDKKSTGYLNAKKLVENFGSNPSLLVPVEVNGTREGIHPPNWLFDEVENIDE